MSQEVNESDDSLNFLGLFVEMSDGTVDTDPAPSTVVHLMPVAVDSEFSEVNNSAAVSSPARLPRKRKRLARSPNRMKSPVLLDEANDNGSTCSICFDNWELAGPHRLTSLRCGHLFGNSCIKRWIEDNTPRNRVCPQCKRRATHRDFRFIYAKKVTAIDNSEEVKLRDQLKCEKEKYIKLETEYSLLNIDLKFERDKCVDLQERLYNLQQLIAINGITS